MLTPVLPPESILLPPADYFADAQASVQGSPQSSEFDDIGIPSIWLHSDLVPPPKTRVKSLMALRTTRLDAERTRPASSALSRVPSFDSARAVSYDSDGLVSYEGGRASYESAGGASVPAVLQPNRPRSASAESVAVREDGAAVEARSKPTRTASSSSDRVLSSYGKLKTLTKRYTLPFRGAGKKVAQQRPPPPPPQ